MVQNSAPQTAHLTKERVEILHREVQSHFLDKSMYDINDALTSILGVCDVESKATIPKIKNYIEHVNESLRSIKLYHEAVSNGSAFNLTMVLKNILQVIEDYYKNHYTICLNLSDLKALANVEQSRFEKLLLFILVHFIESSPPEANHILIDLKQKDQDALLTIVKDHAYLPPSIQGDIDQMTDGFGAKVEFSTQGTGVEMLARIPLLFKPAEPAIRVTLKNPLPGQAKKAGNFQSLMNARGGLRFAF